MKSTMKVRVVVGLLVVSFASAQYPPSGYRPSGRQFVLPVKPNQSQGVGIQLQSQYGPPSNQYGPPARRPSITQTPPDQYLPGLEPTDVRHLGGQQQGFLTQDQQVNRQQQDHQVQVGDQQQYYSEEQINRQQQGYLGQQDRVDQRQQDLGQAWSRQPSSANNNQNFADSGDFGRRQPAGTQQNSGVSSLNRNYLTPQQENSKNVNGQNRNFEQQQSAKQLYRTNGQNDEDNVANSDDEDFRNDDQDQNVAGENYLPPTTTERYIPKPTQRRKYPEPTTRRPITQEPIEPEDNDQDDPNVAIATAVARGQYYLLQPNGRLQRVVYKTTQTQEDVNNNDFSAKLVYQDVQPITAPIYPYSAPLVRVL